MRRLSQHAFGLYITGLSILLVCLFAFSGSPRLPPPPLTSTSSHDFTHARLSAYTAAGNLDYRADIAHIKHNGGSQSADLRDIKIHYLEPAAETQLIAQAGRIDKDTNTIDLQGEVEMLSEEYNHEATKRSRVQTRDVTVDTVRRLAETSAAVTIRQANQRLHGMGLRADLATGRLHIIDDIQLLRE